MGVRGGLLVSLVLVPLIAISSTVLSHATLGEWIRAGGGFGVPALFIVAFITGLLSDLQRSALAEIAARKRVEQSLREAQEKALAASQAKSNFPAGVNHELRTPLNAIIGVGDLLADSPLDARQHEYVRMHRAAADDLLEVIDDILAFSRLDTGQVTIRKAEFSLPDLIATTEAQFADRARGKGLHLNSHIASDLPDKVSCDRAHLDQALANLLDNALKFTAKGSVTLSVDWANESAMPNAVRFRVADTGIGIPREKRETIFEAFSQGDSSATREFGGTGLGLTISRRLVELMGGEMGLESQLGEGSVFSFAIPLGVTPITSTSTLNVPLVRPPAKTSAH